MPVFRYKRPLVEARRFTRDEHTVRELVEWGANYIHFTDAMEWRALSFPGYYCSECGCHFEVPKSPYCLVVSNARGYTVVHPGGWIAHEPTSGNEWHSMQFVGYTQDEFGERYEPESA